MTIGDIVLAIDGVEISNFPELQESMSQYRPGETVVVRVWRESAIVNVIVQLKDRDGQIAFQPDQGVLQKRSLTRS